MRRGEPDPVPPRQRHYPPYIQDEDDRRRFDLCVAIARELLSVDGEPVPEAEVWAMSRSLFRGDLAT